MSPTSALSSLFTICFTLLIFSPQFTPCMEVENQETGDSSLSRLLKNPNDQEMSENLGGCSAFESVVLLQFMTQPRSIENETVICQTGLVIHPNGILTSANGLFKENFFTEIIEINATTLGAKLRLPLYVSSKSWLNPLEDQRCDDCWAYFSKDYYQAFKNPQSSYHTNLITEQNYHELKNDFIFLHVKTETKLPVLNLNQIKHFGEQDMQSFYTCCYSENMDYPNNISNLMKTFSEIELLSREENRDIAISFCPLIFGDTDTSCYMHIAHSLPFYTQYPAFHQVQRGCFGSPIFMVSSNRTPYFFGLLTNNVDAAHHLTIGNGSQKILLDNVSLTILTPALNLDKSTLQPTGLAPVFDSVYSTFLMQLEKAYGFYPKILQMDTTPNQDPEPYSFESRLECMDLLMKGASIRTIQFQTGLTVEVIEAILRTLQGK